MSKGMNKVNLTGNLTRAPELRYTTSGKAYVRFTVACGYSRKDEGGKYVNLADFVNCTAWGPRAEAIAKHFHKGSGIEVSGKISTSSYEKDGQKVFRTEVLANDFYFPPGKREAQVSREGETSPFPSDIEDVGFDVVDLGEEDIREVQDQWFYDIPF